MAARGRKYQGREREVQKQARAAGRAGEVVDRKTTLRVVLYG